MHISSIYLNTYTQAKPITGSFEVQDEGFQHRITFTPDEAAIIQNLCCEAFERHKTQAIQKILNGSIAVPQLSAPKDTTTLDVDFIEVPNTKEPIDDHPF